MEAGFGQPEALSFRSSVLDISRNPDVWDEVAQSFARHFPGLPLDTPSPLATMPLASRLEAIPEVSEEFRADLEGALAQYRPERCSRRVLLAGRAAPSARAASGIPLGRQVDTPPRADRSTYLRLDCGSAPARRRAPVGPRRRRGLRRGRQLTVGDTYTFESGDDDAVIACLGPGFAADPDPLSSYGAVEGAGWDAMRPELQQVVSRIPQLELADANGDVTLTVVPLFGPVEDVKSPLAAEEAKLWKSVQSSPDVPPALAVLVGDLLLSSRADATPANAERVVDGYRALAQIDSDSFHVALAILRANTIARSRHMAAETPVRAEALALAERVISDPILPGNALRQVGVLAREPRTGTRASDEVQRVNAVLDAIAARHGDPSTADDVAAVRIEVAADDAAREDAKRRHIETYLATSRTKDEPAVRAFHWAEQAVRLARRYEIRDLHDTAILWMQELSRSDLGWHRVTSEIGPPPAFLHQRHRQAASFVGWEQALAVFLAGDSPAGSAAENEAIAASRPRGILDLVSGRSFGPHGMPERTHGTSEEERLRDVIQRRLLLHAVVHQTDLDAISTHFGVPDQDAIMATLSMLYGSAPELVAPFAEALRAYWMGDHSGAARLAIPLIEAGARELLILMNEPLYREEKGASPGRYPAMDFYVDTLEKLSLDPDWAQALRSTLLSDGMNLRNRFAHGYKLSFTSHESALLLRLAGLFIAMPVGAKTITDDRLRYPLAVARRRLHRRLGWVWR